MTSITFRTQVTQEQGLKAEWLKNANRLRVADAATDATLAVYSNGEVYGVMAEAPAGHIVITVDERMPRIVEALEHAGVIRVLRKVRDGVFNHTVVLAEVLL